MVVVYVRVSTIIIIGSKDNRNSDNFYFISFKFNCQKVIMKKQYLVCGVGISDIKIRDENGELLKSYVIWKEFLRRCYSKKSHKKNPTYINCTASDEWIYYSNFQKWFDNHYIEGYHLDKDLLQEGVENKIYSADTCIFIPHALNSFFTNTHSTNKSGYIGASWYKKYNNWRASISVYDHENKTKKYKHLGYFDDIIDASNAYKKARQIEAQKWRVIMKERHNWSDDLCSKIK